MIEKILLLEGLNDGCGCLGDSTYTDATTIMPSASPRKRLSAVPLGTQKRGTKKMAALKRISTSRGVRCMRGGRFVKCPTTSTRRRRSRGSFWGNLGQTDAKGLLTQFQPQLVNGGLAAAGAWLSQSLGSKVGKMVNIQAGSTTGNLLTMAVGVLLAGIVGKVTKKPQIGMALGTGAVAITLLNFIGTMSPTAGFGVLQAEAAPYYQRSAVPPLAQMQALPASGSSVPNLYSDMGVASIV